MARWLIPLVVLVPFGLYTDWLVYTDGYTGFLTLAMHDKWALQMLLDVTISVGLFALWMVRDAKERGIPAWPYLIACLAMGSIGALAYLVHRGLRLHSGRARAEDERSVREVDGGRVAVP